MKQVSDIVARSTILAVTKNCILNQCRLSVEILETTTGGISRHYDRDGNLTVNDENRRITRVSCFNCWRHIDVEQKGDNILSVTDVSDEVRAAFDDLMEQKNVR